MPQIISYSGLQDAVARWLNRSDLAPVIPDFIRFAEQTLQRDPRVSRLVVVDPFVIEGETTALPADFKTLDSLWLTGPTAYGELETVSFGAFGDISRRFLTPGIPRFAAIEDQRTLHVRPPPAEPMEAHLAYRATIPYLGQAGVQSNWLLERHSDIYLYASLAEAAPYLRDDPRLIVWRTELETRLELLHQQTERAMYSGDLRMRPARAIP